MNIKRRKFNICLLGESLVGKSSIINRYKNNEFEESLMTMYFSPYILKKTFNNIEYTFKIFDTPGQERYRSFSNTYLKISDGFFMVFAVDNKESFERGISWIKDIEDYFNLEEKVLFLLGTKIDVKPEEKQVTKEEVEEIAKSMNIKYFETSARTKEGINEAFEEMFKDVLEQYKMNRNKKTNHLDKIDIRKEKERNKEIKYNYEMNNQNNKKKSNYSPFSNYILDKFNKY